MTGASKGLHLTFSPAVLRIEPRALWMLGSTLLLSYIPRHQSLIKTNFSSGTL